MANQHDVDINFETLRRMTPQRLFDRAIEFSDALLEEHPMQGAILHFLSGIYLALIRQIGAQSDFGANKFAITPVLVETTATKILEKDDQGRVRKIQIAVDSVIGGPPVTIRVGGSSVNSGGGGILVPTGALTFIGEVDPDVELFAAADADIQVYVMEAA